MSAIRFWPRNCAIPIKSGNLNELNRRRAHMNDKQRSDKTQMTQSIAAHLRSIGTILNTLKAHINTTTNAPVNIIFKQNSHNNSLEHERLFD